MITKGKNECLQEYKTLIQIMRQKHLKTSLFFFLQFQYSKTGLKQTQFYCTDFFINLS